MKYFIDTEFYERGHEYPIQLISIGIVAEDRREYYAEVAGVDVDSLSPWLKENVVPFLSGPKRTRQEIASDIIEFFGKRPCSMCGGSGEMVVSGLIGPRRCELCVGTGSLIGSDRNPEIWGYFADYDWVVFSQLYGRMIELPQGMPHFCRDLKQLADSLGVSKKQYPSHGGNKHNALDDARWNLRLFNALETWEQLWP